MAVEKTPASGVDAKARPVLSAGFAALALRIQEATTVLSQSDIRRRLSCSLEDTYRGTGTWCYLLDIFGDDQSGEVVYECSGDLKKAPYTCSKSGAVIDTAKAVDVVPFTTYELEATDLTEAGRRNSSRDLKQLQSIHDGAVGLGAVCTAVKESALIEGAGLKLVERFTFTESAVLELIESSAGTENEFEALLISPGKGSSAIYPAETLQREAAKFKKGTQVYINHATEAEERERPEGDWHKLAGALTTDGYWKESSKWGPGVFAKVGFAPDWAPSIKAKSSYSGMSIRAGGNAVMESGKPKLQDGLPVLHEFTNIESVDIVTRAGRGGMILNEAARSANPNEGGADEMDAAELTKLKESLALREANEKKLLERALRGDAREYVATALKGITLHEAGKELVLESVMRGDIPQKDGVLDETKLKESVDAEAKRVGAAIAAATGSGRVSGMGTPAPVVPIDANEAARREAHQKSLRESAVRNFVEMGMEAKAAELSADRMLGVA